MPATDQELRTWWIQQGGDFHGPHVETATITEARLFKLLRRLKVDPNQRLVAWHIDINSMSCIVYAETLPKARWKAVSNYWEAGYGRKGLWPNPKACRAPRYDNHPELIRQPTICHSEQNLR